MGMTPEQKRAADALSDALRLLANAGMDYMLVAYVPGAKSPMFFSNEPPPGAFDKAHAALDECAKLAGLAVVNLPREH